MEESKKRSSAKLGLVITDGVGYRNFILSNFSKEAQSQFSKTIIFSGLPASAYIDLDLNHFTIVELPIFIENKIQWFWRKMKEVAHLRLHAVGNKGIQDNLQMNYRSGWRPNDLLIKLIYIVTYFFHSERTINFYESLQEFSFRDSVTFKAYKRIIEANPVDVLFFTHQRPPFVTALVAAAKLQNLKTACFIFSWDNLASKGRMAALFDDYLVWSKLMKIELLTFYKSVIPTQVTVVGTPQFEPYVMPNYTRDKEASLKMFKLDPDKKTICYSCADQTIGVNDLLVIRTIAHAIMENKINDVQLLIRTSPAEDESRFSTLKKEYPFILWNHPKWHQSRSNHPEPWSQRIPLASDIQELINVLEVSDLNVNMCSTMSLDFMIFEKPVINTVFGNRENGLYDDQRFLNYDHYDRVVKSGAVVIAKNPEELIKEINSSLTSPSKRLSEQNALIHIQIGKPLRSTSKGMVNELGKIARGE